MDLQLGHKNKRVMRINAVDLQNFRKLKSVRIAFSQQTTLFVGANNSGKTSAMLALGHFLVDPRRFNTNDFTLANWKLINKIGEDLLQDKSGESAEASLQKWVGLVPTLDVWIDV